MSKVTEFSVQPAANGWALHVGGQMFVYQRKVDLVRSIVRELFGQREVKDWKIVAKAPTDFDPEQMARVGGTSPLELYARGRATEAIEHG